MGVAALRLGFERWIDDRRDRPLTAHVQECFTALTEPVTGAQIRPWAEESASISQDAKTDKAVEVRPVGGQQGRIGIQGGAPDQQIHGRKGGALP